MNAIDAIEWGKDPHGLIPAIIQHAESGEVLMLGYMNREALDETQRLGQVTFFSRSKQRLWTKGESSGHVLKLVSLHADCDGDTLLVRALPQGPTCHLGTRTCFADAPAPAAGFLAELDALIEHRAQALPEGSYTTRLLQSGLPRMAQKVGEEGVEAALAAVCADDAALTGEAADLLFHTLVLLRARGLGLADVMGVLRERHAAKGLPPS